MDWDFDFVRRREGACVDQEAQLGGKGEQVNPGSRDGRSAAADCRSHSGKKITHCAVVRLSDGVLWDEDGILPSSKVGMQRGV